MYRAVKGTGTDPEEVPKPVLDVLADSGQSLDGTVQRALGDRMDADFSNVRIHTGAKAAEAAEAIDAKAFTCGNDIVFNAGEYDPNSAEGQFLLAHELAHVTQQTGAAISMMPKPDADLEIDPDPQLERQADEVATQALSGEEPLTISRLGTDVHIQRLGEHEALQAMALFESELADGDLDSHREAHNRLQLEYLSGFVDGLVEKQQDEAKLEISQIDNPDAVAAELQHRIDRSEHELKSDIQELSDELDGKLDNVALTEDQRRALSGDVETNKVDRISWTIIKPLLVGTGITKLLEVADLAEAFDGGDVLTAKDAGTQAKEFDVNDEWSRQLHRSASEKSVVSKI
ncbi:eCIS core domain-containing protein [Natrialba chahannaoensis]|uniref:eCIS core domain-containing protein n=1 Tax=Natrialba chahannaoensis TaxID=68911 RepID=UPI001F4D06AE|nr:DUF4157 domain-containing protein [Natrialba chahannaoensis]